MDFRFAPEQENFRGEVRDFLQDALPADWVGSDNAIDEEAYGFGREFLKKLAPRKWIAPAWPAEYGGLGMGLWDQVIFNEEMSYARAPVINTPAVGYLGPTIMIYGTEEQKQQHLDGITSGEVQWCQGYSEPGSGSDLASLQTRALQDGDDFVINGQKIWTSQAHYADWIFLLARTDADAPKHKGISYFLVDMKSPGISVRPLINLANGKGFNEVFFDNVRVPRSGLLGEQNRGWYMATTTLDFERSSVSTSAGMRRSLEELGQYCAETRWNGGRLLDKPSVKHKLVDLTVEISIIQLLSYRVVTMQEKGIVPNHEASIVKVFNSELNQRLGRAGIGILGLHGQLDPESPHAKMYGRFEKLYLTSLGSTIAAGTSEIQRNIIASRGLGLPKVLMPDIKPPPGFWQREASHYPKPLTPLGSDFIVEPINSSFRKVFEEFGFPLEGLEFREIGGYVYQRLKPLGAGEGAGPTTLPPKPVLWAVLRLHPAFRKRAARCQESLDTRADKKFVERWYDEYRPKLTKDIERFRAVRVVDLSEEELATHLEEVWNFGHYGFDVHFYLTLTWFPMVNLSFFLRDHLGYSDEQVLPLLSGLSETSSEPARALAKLASAIRVDEQLKNAVVAARSEAVADVLRERDSALAGQYDDYVDHYGFRALRYELVEPCLNEKPDVLGQVLQDQLRRPAGVEEEQKQLASAREAAEQEALAALPTEELRNEFLELLRDARRAYGIREENEFYTVSVPLALARSAVLEAGGRLVMIGALAAVDDVFLLNLGELIAGLRDGVIDKDAVERRRAELKAAQSFDPPASYGKEPPQPPFDVFPPATKLAMEVLVHATNKVFEPELSNSRAETGAQELKGIAAARGSYSGPARIITGEEQFDRLQPGDVLVCPITSPVWSILFAKVGALVTDSGGILSHPAIIAREYGIPAVVATGNATQIIPDGQQITVDGNTGVVQVVG